MATLHRTSTRTARFAETQHLYATVICKVYVLIGRMCGVMSYTTAPKSAPTPAVSAIASAPQNVTRKAAFVTGAPPAWAPNPPNSAKNRIEVPTTTGISAA